MRPSTLILLLLSALLCACGVESDRGNAIGEAYAGPASLTLRREIDLKSPPAAVVRHGEKLEIVAQRRRLYKVRTSKGLEGWTQDSNLLDSLQMYRLRALAEESEGMPSQGVATVFDLLRVHTEPNRLSPSFVEIAPNEKVDVIAHKVTVRKPLPRRRLIEPKPKIERKPKGGKESAKYPPPPGPAPPPLPKDWVALSKTRAAAPEENQPPAAHDDWTLIRTKSGPTGWVLTSRLYMAIPDEVAQYAEGHRITAYFSLGKVRDEKLAVEKDIWLWTTAESLGEDHDFDGYRVFVWSLNHHRYETAYIQRRESGYFPVIVKNGEFSVCLDPAEGATARVRKRYSLIGNRVQPAGEGPCEVSRQEDEATGLPANLAVKPAPAKGFFARSIDKVRGIFGKK